MKNCLPYDVIIYDQRDCKYDTVLKKWILINESPMPLKVVKQSGTVLKAKFCERPRSTPDLDGFPIRKRIVEILDPIPKGNEEDLIVFNTYIQIAKDLNMDTTKLYALSDVVYDHDNTGKPVGCLGLQPAYDIIG